jgi:hypothetical protein
MRVMSTTSDLKSSRPTCVPTLPAAAAAPFGDERPRLPFASSSTRFVDDSFDPIPIPFARIESNRI